MTGNCVLASPPEEEFWSSTVLFPRTRCRLHAMVTSAGYDSAGPGYDWHGLRRGEAPFVLLQHTVSGRGRLRFEGRDLLVGEGQTMLLRFPHDNRYWVGRGDRWEFFWLCLNGREILRLWREMLGASGPVVRLPETSVERLAELCRAVRRGDAQSAARASEIAYATAMCLAAQLLAPGEAQSEPRRPLAVERAAQLCRAHARGGDRLDVGRMAAAAGLSRHHFGRVFAASEGVPPARYLLRQRIEQAATLLRTEPVSVKEVARRCGFADANYFAKAFRRTYAISPTEFRRSGAFGQDAAARAGPRRRRGGEG